MNKKEKLAALAAKGRAIIRERSSVKVPNFNILDYKLSMMRALNYYSAEVEDKDKRKFAIAYWKKQGKDVSVLSSLPDYWFSTIGAVSHLALNDIALSDHDLIRLDNAYTQLILETKKPDETAIVATATKKPQKSIQDHIEDAARVHIAELEAGIDELLLNGTVTDAKTYLSSNQVKAPVAKKIADWFKNKASEFKTAMEDKELCDGYGGKRVLNKLLAQVEAYVADCNTVAIIAKTTRAPRVRKQQPPSKLVAKMKWLKEFAELNMKSVFPEKIIGASELWLYDTAKRRLIRYVAQDGMELSVKGTTVMNFDPNKSGSKIVRKPEILKNYDSLGKRPFGNLFNDIKATLGKLNGRTSDSQLILKVF